MTWTKCDCGKPIWFTTPASKSSSLSRCRREHVAEDNLELPRKWVTKTNMLFSILNHGGERLARRCREDLLGLGVPKHNVFVQPGYVYGTAMHCDRILKTYELTHYGVRFRWFPRVHKIISKRKQRPAAVVYCESNTCFKDVDLADLVARINSRSATKWILWLGFRKIHSRIRNKRMVEGSKCIIFVEAGLKEGWRAAAATDRFGHWDMQLSRYVPEKSVLADESLVGSRRYKSVIMGKGAAVWRLAT